MGRSKCCVPNCIDRGSATQHVFPVYEEYVFKIWINRIANPKFVGRSDIDIYKSFAVCGNHFIDECRSIGTKRLKLYSLPTLRLPGFNEEPTLKNSFWKLHAGMNPVAMEKNPTACEQGPVGENSTQVQKCGISHVDPDPVHSDALVNTGPVGTFPTPTYTYGRKGVSHLNLDSSTPLSSISENKTVVYTRPQVHQTRSAAVQEITPSNEVMNPELKDCLDYLTSAKQIKSESGESQNVTEDNSTIMLRNLLESEPGPTAIHKATSTETLVEPESQNCLDFQIIEQIKIEPAESQAETEHQEYDLFNESAAPSADPLAEDCPSSREAEPVKNLCRRCTESAESVEKLCRLCTKSAGENAVNLFVEKYLGREILAMLNTLLPDTFAEVDGLSQLVCTACVNKVNLCYDTVQTFVSADKKLREMLKDQQKGEQLEPQGVVVSKEDTSCVTNDRTSELVKCHVKVVLKNNSPQNGSTLMCSGCKELFTDLSLAQQHKRMKCNNSVNLLRVMFKCSHCEKLFSQKASLLEHKRVHSNPRPELLICHICGKTMKYLGNMNRHLQNHENEEFEVKPDKKLEHICHICGRVLKHKKSFDKHLLKHDTSLTFVCSSCGNVYKTLASLRTHEKRHRDRLVPASCPLCKKNLRNKMHLQTHLAWTHSGRRKRLCHLCGTLLCSGETFKMHLEKHKGLNTNMSHGLFKCTFCDRSFQQKFQLSSHIRRHTGVKEFRCTICNKEFYTKEHLRRHSLTHSSLRIHKCDVCSKAFKTKSILVRHKARNCNPVKRNLLCSICDIKLPSVTDLKKHRKEKHSSQELSKACNSLKNIVSLDFLCTVCNNCFASQDELLMHKQTLHSTVSSPSEPDVDAENQGLEYPQNMFYL